MLDAVSELKRDNALLRKLLMRFIDDEGTGLDSMYMVAARCMAEANKKADQRDRAYNEVETLEKRLKVVTTLSDKQARENKQLAAKCARLDAELSKATDTGRKLAALAESMREVVARAEDAKRQLTEAAAEARALEEQASDRATLIARAEDAERQLAAAAAEAEARALKERATDRATLVENVAEWEAAVKQYKDKIGTAKIALSRVQSDRFSEYRAKCAFLRIKMD